MADFRSIQQFQETQGTRANVRQNSRLPISAQKTSIWQREIEFSKPFSGQEKQHFFHLLAMLMEAGLSITESLEVIQDQLKKKKSREIVQTLIQQLNEGHSLSEAAALQSKYFSKFEIFSLKMGEKAGQMIVVLFDLAIYHEKRTKLQRKFSQALSYPAVVITIAGGVLFFMINYVVPMFSDIFNRFDAELPQITQMVIGLSEFSKAYGLWLMGLFILMAFGIFHLRKNATIQQASSWLSSKIPIIGKIILKIQFSRFCYTLGLMLRSKVSLDQALELMEEIIQFYPIKKTIPQIRKDIIEGKTLYEAILPHAIYPHVMIQMIKVGERTASLDKMVGNLAKNLEEESDASITTLTTLLEPILIVILGLMVGIILISMYLPMFELSSAISA